MAEQKTDDTITSKESSRLKWTKAKKEEYKTGAYDPNNPLDWRNMPLFSNALDPNNPSAAAIMSLQKKEKPRHRAKTFKNSGNKAYLLGKGRYKDAITYYTQALEVKCTDNTLNSTIYANRAQVQLCLQNYGKVISDCAQSIALQPNTYKSYWRAATAYRALAKHTKAIKSCEDGIAVMERLIESERVNPTLISEKMRNDSESESSENESETKTAKKSELQKLTEQIAKLKQLKQKCIDEKSSLDRKNALKLQKELEMRVSKAKKVCLVSAKLKERGIVIGTKDLYNVRQSYGKYGIEYDNKMDSLVFAVMFVYPEYEQSDFIKAFGENQRFSDHLSTMFAPKGSGPSWDKDGIYLSHRLSVYYETEDRFVNVNVNKCLKDIVEREGYVIPVMPVFFVLTKDSGFTNEFLRKKSNAVLKL